jgi:hypothetical protein
MFKFIFRVITISLFLVFLTIGLAIWKGGEPFRWCGEGLVMIGKTVSNFGDVVDELVDGGKKIQKSYDRLKDVIPADKGN